MSTPAVLKNVVDLSISAVDVSVSSANILSSARDVQGAATSMASAIEELAASIGEIEGSAQRSAQAADESNRLTQSGSGEVRALGNLIAETAQSFDGVTAETQQLQKTVADLGKVVELISKIASQTNLLALNATIEAARAGEHGKGFSVVASEVKSLSRQTHEATETITKQIGVLNQSFSHVLGGMGQAQKVMQTVSTKSREVLGDFDQISQNAGAISGQISELAGIIGQQREAISLLAKNMTVVKEKGDDNLSAVEVLADQTDRTVKLIESWRTEVANEDIPNKVVFLAKADHVLWKKRLLDMALGRSTTKASDLTDHTLCRLGKWYYSQTNSSFAAQAAFRELEEPHKQVHFHGIEAAKLFEQGKIREGMVHYSQLDAASQKVVACLDRLISTV